MKLETKRRLSMLLLAVAVIFWLLRQLAVVYIPGVSASELWRGPCSCWPPAWTAAAPARRPP
ncbi:MAG: hypothetical protein ACLR5H_07790 [Oscillospiraceae bacterium]